MKKIIINSIFGIILCVILISIIRIKTSNTNNMITYDFSSSQVVEISIFNDLTNISKNYTTYITINNDRNCTIEMWPSIEKNAIYPIYSFSISENQLRELKDILNRYSFKNKNNLSDLQNKATGNITLEISANNKIYKFSNNIKDENLDVVKKFIENLVPLDILEKYNNEVIKYLEY